MHLHLIRGSMLQEASIQILAQQIQIELQLRIYLMIPVLCCYENIYLRLVPCCTSFHIECISFK